jgi:hypothetical protein
MCIEDASIPCMAAFQVGSSGLRRSRCRTAQTASNWSSFSGKARTTPLLWRPDSNHPGGWVFASELRLPPNSVGRWDIPFHTADLNGWPDETPSPMELGYFGRRYRLTLVVMTESGRKARWRRARSARVRD